MSQYFLVYRKKLSLSNYTCLALRCLLMCVATKNILFIMEHYNIQIKKYSKKIEGFKYSRLIERTLTLMITTSYRICISAALVNIILFNISSFLQFVCFLFVQKSTCKIRVQKKFHSCLRYSHHVNCYVL